MEQSVLDHSVRVLESLEGFVKDTVVAKYLIAPEKIWQPSELLPNLESENWHDAIRIYREEMNALPDSTLVVLTGNTLTEEGLPTYMSMLNRYRGLMDKTGASEDGFARWARYWTAEEARHDAALSHALYLSGRVNMLAVERTKQHLLRNGFDPGVGDDPYGIIAYTCMQEPATQISHENVAKLAQREGASTIARICTKIGSDERRHAAAYQAILKEIIAVDPRGLVALHHVARNGMTMPGARMDNPAEQSLFESFSQVGLHTRMYTGHDYGNIIKELNSRLGIDKLSVAGDAAKAQDYLCSFPARNEAVMNYRERKAKAHVPRQFSWIYGRAA